MKIFTLTLIRKVMAIAVLLFVAGISYGATFTATASGNFSSSATWSGGVVPPTTITSDVIIIPAGITVTLDEDLTIDGALAQLEVSGTLTSTDKSLAMVEGTLSGTGSISIKNVDLKPASTFAFTGSMLVKDLYVDATFSSTADMTVDKKLALQSGDMTVTTGGSLALTPQAKIQRSGGSLTVGTGGTVDLSTDYSLTYSGTSFTTGIELDGTGLKELEINMDAGNTLTLSSDLTLTGKLALNGGTLALAGNDLTVNGDITSTTSGKILTTSQSDVTINSFTSTTDAMNFEAGSEIKDLIINLPPEYAAKIEGYLSVYGDLNLISGILKMNDANVSIYGDVSGTGTFSTTPLTNLAINTSGELSTSLKFDTSGQVVNNFTVSVGTDNTLTLDSDLTVKGDLALTNASILKLNGTTLTLDATSTMSGDGKLEVDQTSSLNVFSSTPIDALKIDGTIGDLMFSTADTTTVKLASDLKVGGMLTLQSGTVMLNDRDLTIAGDVSTTGSGRIYSTSTSDVTFTSGSTGALTFGDGSTVKTLTIDAGTNFTSTVSGDFTVDSLLKLNSGVMAMNDASLTLKGDLSGDGMFSSTNSDMTISSTTTLSSPLRFTTDAQTLNSLTIAVGENNKVTMGSDLTVNGMLSLTDGSALDISGKTLILDSESNISGSGFIKVDSTSSFTVNATTDISSLKMDGTIGNLTINTTDASVTLSSDAKVAGTLTLASGDMILNKYDLIVNGDVSTTGTGTLSSTAESDIKIETSTSTSGALRFSSTANTVGDMTVKVTDGGTATIDSDLNIDKTLYLNGGTMDINDQTLSFSSTSTIVGASSTNYIRTSTDGFVEREVTAGGSTVIYPIGTFTSYAPVEVKLNPDSESGKIQVGVSSDVYASGTTGTDLSYTQPMVDATWSTKTSIRSEHLDMQMKVVWHPAMEANNFDRTEAYISQFSEGSWDESTPVAAVTEPNGMFSITRDGITTATQFAVFDANTVTALNDPELAGKISVYPNPAKDQIVVTKPASIDNALKMEIYSPSGLLIQKYDLIDPLNSIEVGDLTNGNYFIRFTDGKTTATKQLTKI